LGQKAERISTNQTIPQESKFRVSPLHRSTTLTSARVNKRQSPKPSNRSSQQGRRRTSMLDGDPIHHAPIQHESLLPRKLNRHSLEPLPPPRREPSTRNARRRRRHTVSVDPRSTERRAARRPRPVIHESSGGGGATDAEALGRTDAPAEPAPLPLPPLWVTIALAGWPLPYAVARF
jgi:hypothetical protein